ncbi:TetR/AcrR family transcriptional regulator [Companilactobacillus furfuricola]|uniref:TetR/AcrR family transcriptional regulator n=1 Tax=Companilactobacillus furfuricola TaxID=1462575 RepID=UPI000F78E0A0|nr:TetR/AcrR family transcriptional regulator [Companilactobacillus furfuricola]
MDQTRTKFDKKRLADTLFDLLEDEELESISVEGLCEAANLEYHTFYVYYSDLDDVFNEYKNEIYTEVSKALALTNSDLENILDAFDRTMANNFKGFCQLCLYKKHYDLEDKLQRKLFAELEGSLLVNQTSANDQLVLQYLSSGLINSYIYWFEHPQNFNYQALRIINRQIIQSNLAMIR